MKPTKEQLADPKWWDENSGGRDFLYECECTNEIVFADKEGRDSNNLRLRFELGVWKLLAKRPEPEWVPEVGEECEYYKGESYRKGEVLKIDKNESFPVYAMVDSETNMLYWSADLRPIKTQREELIDIVYSNNGNPAELIADSILARFDLTKKDG